MSITTDVIDAAERGKYQAGSCIVCGTGTDTAVATRGEAEYHVAFLICLGVPKDQAPLTHSLATGCDQGMVRPGRYELYTRVCARCFRNAFPKTNVRPTLFVDGGQIPMLTQSEDVGR